MTKTVKRLDYPAPRWFVENRGFGLPVMQRGGTRSKMFRLVRYKGNSPN